MYQELNQIETSLKSIEKQLQEKEQYKFKYNELKEAIVRHWIKLQNNNLDELLEFFKNDIKNSGIIDDHGYWK